MKLLQMINPGRLKKTRFYRSFKLDKSFLYIILIDLAYYAVLYMSVVIYLRNIIPELSVANRAKDLIGLISNETTALYQSDLTAIREARSNLTIYGIILIIVLILNFSCFKLWIWHRIVKRKYRIIPLTRGIIVNFIFFIIISLLGLAGFYILKTEIFLVYLLLLIPISTYFLNWVHLLFAQKASISAIYKGFYLGVKRFFHLLIPNLIIIVLLFLLILVMKMLDTINPKIYWPIFFLCFTILLNWAKHLLYLYKKPFVQKNNR